MPCFVVSCDERFQGRTTTLTSEGYKRVRSFRVIVSEPAYNADEVVLSYEAIPRIGDRYSETATQYASQITCELLSESLRIAYLVKVDYVEPSLADKQKRVKVTETRPWDEHPTYRRDYNTYQKPLEKDKSADQKPVLTSAGEPFDSQPMVDASNAHISVSRSSLSYSFSAAWALSGTINATPFTIDGVTVPPHYARLLKWSADDASWTDSEGITWDYFIETLEFELTKELGGFDLQPLDCGFRDKNGQVLKDKDGNPVTSPALLKDGLQTTTPSYLLYQGYDAADWAAIGSLP